MKKSFFAMAVIITFCISCQMSLGQNLQAFKRLTPDTKAHIITDSLRRILSLSDVQYSKVYVTALEGMKKAAPIINSDAGKMSKGMQLRSILNDTEDKLKNILTEQQFTLYESTKEKTIAYCRQQANDGKISF